MPCGVLKDSREPAKVLIRKPRGPLGVDDTAVVRKRCRRGRNDIEPGAPNQVLGRGSHRARRSMQPSGPRKCRPQLPGRFSRRSGLQNRDAGDGKCRLSGLQPQVLHACSADTVNVAGWCSTFHSCRSIARTRSVSIRSPVPSLFTSLLRFQHDLPSTFI